MNDKIREFLKETELQNSATGTWGIGTAIARAGAKPILMLMSLKSVNDQFVVASKRDDILLSISKILSQISISVKDPTLFDVPTASFSALICRSFLGRMGKPCLLFATVRAVSDTSSHILLEGYSLGAAAIAGYHVKEAGDEIKKITNG